jgi:hypothetical protein
MTFIFLIFSGIEWDLFRLKAMVFRRIDMNRERFMSAGDGMLEGILKDYLFIRQISYRYFYLRPFCELFEKMKLLFSELRLVAVYFWFIVMKL